MVIELTAGQIERLFDLQRLVAGGGRRGGARRDDLGGRSSALPDVVARHDARTTPSYAELLRQGDCGAEVGG